MDSMKEAIKRKRMALNPKFEMEMKEESPEDSMSPEDKANKYDLAPEIKGGEEPEGEISIESGDEEVEVEKKMSPELIESVMQKMGGDQGDAMDMESMPKMGKMGMKEDSGEMDLEMLAKMFDERDANKPGIMGKAAVKMMEKLKKMKA